MPIVRSDREISSLLKSNLNKVQNIVDIFVHSKTSVHLLRAVEPTLRFGQGILKHLEENSEDPLPKCEYYNTPFENKCISLASRKQIGEVLVSQNEKK